MHCTPDNVLVEIINDGRSCSYGEQVEIVLTSLTNRAMPFIRYAVGDRGVLLPGDTCPCNNANPVLDIKAGRLADYVNVLNAPAIHSIVFWLASENINLSLDYPIIQFQVIQETLNKFTVYFVLEKSKIVCKNSVEKLFLKSVRKHGFPDNTEWTFSYLEEICPDSSTGKLPLIHGIQYATFWN